MNIFNRLHNNIASRLVSEVLYRSLYARAGFTMFAGSLTVNVVP